MFRQSSLAARPKSLDDLIGQEEIVKRIRRGVKKTGPPKGYLFTGEKGSGKSSISGIIALALQCKHQKVFGIPCRECRVNRDKYPIYKLNCARNRNVADLEKFVDRADYFLTGTGRRKVFILEEIQELSKTAQRVLLDQTESVNNNAIWIANTTDPDSVNEALRSRFKMYGMRSPERDDLVLYITKILKKLESELAPDDLADALVENGITSFRLVAHAIDSYVEGATAEQAAEVDASTKTNVKALRRAVVKGEWSDVAAILKKSSKSEVRSLRLGLLGYLRLYLLDNAAIDERGNAIAQAMVRLSYVGRTEDQNQLSALVAELYTLCGIFSERSL
jgi:DNA polymerase III gamma/tau subunit